MSDWNVYPRPNLRRENNYMILNDEWSLNDLPIRLPFPPQAKASGYTGEVGDELCYRRQLTLPKAMLDSLTENNKRLLLHFGAVDQITDVYADGELLCHNEGGYLPFTADLTEQILKGKGKVDLRVDVIDTLDQDFPYGKQTLNRGGMWYTPVSGIWQSVWCEVVPNSYLTNIRFSPRGTKVSVELTLQDGSRPESASLTVHTPDEDLEVLVEKGEGEIDLSANPRYWCPKDPYLYNVEIRCGEDLVTSYFGLREITISQIGDYRRICLNGQPIFLHGVLDQGYHEQGLFTPEEPEEYERDILRMKELGINLLRKHIKVEPQLFYYACDRLGMLVMQDMVNNGPYKFGRDTVLASLGIGLNDRRRYTNERQRKLFLETAEATQDFTYNHPSVIAYTVFNEGWGQTDSDEIGDYLKSRDGSRIYDYTSGWFAQKHSDLDSKHIYFRTKKLKAGKKPLLLSEFGGFTRRIEGHLFNTEKSYGYGTCNDERELTDRIVATYEKMVLPAISKGLCGSIYTQVSDVEDEINGFYTYDRQICKVDQDKMIALSKAIDKGMSL